MPAPSYHGVPGSELCDIFLLGEGDQPIGATLVVARARHAESRKAHHIIQILDRVDQEVAEAS